MILGIDPGLEGAIAVYQPGGKLYVLDLPILMRQVNGNARATLDEEAVIETLSMLASTGATDAIIESVNGLPGQSAPAAFNFGMGYGVVKTAARAAGLRCTFTRAAEWKKALRVPADKKLARARASDLFPNHGHLWPLVKHSGRAEAAMIALWGEKHGGL